MKERGGEEEEEEKEGKKSKRFNHILRTRGGGSACSSHTNWRVLVAEDHSRGLLKEPLPTASVAPRFTRGKLLNYDALPRGTISPFRSRSLDILIL